MTDLIPIYHFRMPTQYLLTSTFIRFQESYESPEFAGRGFSLEEFQDWYAETHSGVFSYYDDWTGCNFPSTVVDNFIPSRFGLFSQKEQWVFEQLYAAEGTYYVIGSSADLTGKESSVHHELVHGLYHLYPEYAKQVDTLVAKYQLKALRNGLLANDYLPRVINDEINAYLTTGLIPGLRNKSKREAAAIRQELLELFKATFGFDISKEEAADQFAAERIHLIDGSSIRNVWNNSHTSCKE